MIVLCLLLLVVLPLLLQVATFHSGQGGKITSAAADMHVTDWELTINSRQAEVTNSGSAGTATYQHLLMDSSYRANLPWDSTNIPGVSVAGFMPGVQSTVTLMVGASGKFFSFPGLTESLQTIVNSQTDIVRAVIAGKVNGAIVHPVAG